MALLIKNLNSLAYASVKSRDSLAVASIKNINGLDATGGGIDPDAQNYFDEITMAGSTIDSTARTAINSFVIGCKADLIWSLLQDIGPICGDDLTGALVKLKKLSSGWSYGNNGFSGGDYSQATGLGDVGGGSYLTTGVLGTDLTNNSTGIGVYDRSTANSTVNIHGSVGSDGSNNRFVLYNIYSNGSIYSDQYDSSNEIGSSSIGAVAVGFVFATRPASNSHVLYRNGSSVASSSTVGGSLPGTEIHFFGYNNNGSHAGECTHTMAFLCLTAGMDSTQAAAFNTRVQTLQTALGRNV